ncbi:hypothetical protein GCM10009799_23820 [Nocardiopsis rhodophaea]|uniref:DUF397 domain-containing protein n=1 Tax=Nocardiopsis rhodophaea TaxID=280238 RepID=A0ABN2T140_9ACTN
MTRTTDWFKSSYSAGASNACVEVRISPRGIDVRDSMNPTSTNLAFSGTEWQAFLTSWALGGGTHKQ